MVSRDSVRIALTIAFLIDLDVLACDIQNTYLAVECRERVWVVSGTKFGSKAGQNMLVRKSLYVPTSSGTAFRALLAETLDAIGYQSIYANQ